MVTGATCDLCLIWKELTTTYPAQLIDGSRCTIMLCRTCCSLLGGSHWGSFGELIAGGEDDGWRQVVYGGRVQKRPLLR